MRVILVGGPKRGKSTYAVALRAQGIPTLCTDARSTAREPDLDVTYLPEGLDWSEASQWVADNWFGQPGPWCIDGVAAVRALRKWRGPGLPADRVVVFRKKVAKTSPGQEAMSDAVQTIWREVARHFRSITEYV